MSWWNSIEALDRFHVWIQVVAVILAILAAVATGVSIMSGKRIQKLQAVRAEEDRAAGAKDAADLKNKLAAADAAVSKADRELADMREQAEAEQRARAAAEQRRRTPPLLDADLTFERPGGDAIVTITSKNLIPFECRISIVTTGNVYVTSAQIGWSSPLFPTQALRVFTQPKPMEWFRVRDYYLELWIDFRSREPDLYSLPGHRGTIIKKYRVGADLAITEIPRGSS